MSIVHDFFFFYSISEIILYIHLGEGTLASNIIIGSKLEDNFGDLSHSYGDVAWNLSLLEGTFFFFFFFNAEL